MLKKCSNCGKEFLTEADLFVYKNTVPEYYSCGCKEFKTLFDRTAIDAEMLDLLKGFVGIADKWIPHWKQPNAFKIQIKATKEFLSSADL